MRILKWTAPGAWLLLAAFALIMVAASTVAGRVGDVETNDLRNWLPANADSTRAIDIAQTHFTAEQPENLLIVYARDSGITAQDRAAVAAALGGDQTPPSRDGKALLLLVPLTPAQLDEGTLPGVLDGVRNVVNDGLPDGLQARLTGGPAAAADFDAAFDSIDVTVLAVTVGVVALLLLLTYRSPILLLLPLVAVGAASQLANALVYLCAKHLGLVVDGASAGILTVLVFGAGTDYALLIISRYREELGRHENRYEAMRLALRQSRPPITASAATVILALLTLTFAEMNSTRGLGPVAAIGIASAFVAMTTFLPAMLVLAGRWAFWPFAMRPSRVSWGFAARHPRPIWMAKTYSSSSNVVRMMTRVGIPWMSMRRNTSSPSIRGMRTSRRTTSGLCAVMSSSAASPSSASPHSSRSGSTSMSVRMPSRTRAWSSTSATRINWPPRA